MIGPLGVQLGNHIYAIFNSITGVSVGHAPRNSAER